LWDFPTLFLFYKSVLLIHGPLQFPLNLRIDLSISAKQTMYFMSRDSIGSLEHFGLCWLLSDINPCSLNTNIACLLFACVFFHFFHQCFVVFMYKSFTLPKFTHK
jgi:hypothetical protein